MPSVNGGPVIDSLVYCWDVLNPRSYPGTGATWTDLVKGATLSLPPYAAGAICLNGTSSGISGSQPTGLTQHGTREFLVYVASFSNCTLYHLGINITGRVGINGVNNRQLMSNYTDNSSIMYGSSQINLGWNHIVVTVDTVLQQHSIYLNGVLDATESRVGTAQYTCGSGNAALFQMGYYGPSNDGYFSGAYSLARAYSRPLSANEVKQNYLSLVGRMRGLVSTGGIETTSSSWRLHAFTTPGANTFTVTQPGLAEVLIVAGGGASGREGSGPQGGGGGGGVRYFPCLFIPTGTHTLTVGAGGAIGASSNAQGNSGGNSSAFGVIAYGGGGGGSAGLAGNQSGLGGGSGGGNGGRTTLATLSSGYTGEGGVVQGYAGGASLGGGSGTGAAGGGGGAVGPATAASLSGDYIGGAGGAGFSCSITGSAVTYGDGGGGGARGGFGSGTGGAAGGTGAGAGVASAANDGPACNPGVANRGGGAGGGSYGSVGAAGGSGVIYIRRLN